MEWFRFLSLVEFKVTRDFSELLEGEYPHDVDDRQAHDFFRLLVIPNDDHLSHVYSDVISRGASESLVKIQTVRTSGLRPSGVSKRAVAAEDS
jgi:hypothetical protein